MPEPVKKPPPDPTVTLWVSIVGGGYIQVCHIVWFRPETHDRVVITTLDGSVLRSTDEAFFQDG